MWDCHCHLAAPNWEDLDRSLEEARQAGISGWLSCAYDLDSWPRQLALAGRPGVLIALGLHPWVAPQWSSESHQRLESYLRQGQALAIGECGLDFVRARREEERNQQRLVLREHLALAWQFNLPLILHCVRAQSALREELDRYPGVRAMIHGFLGSPQEAKEWLHRGLFLSLGPHAISRRELMQSLPLDRILIETDAPSRGIRLLDLLPLAEAWKQLQPLQEDHFEANLFRFLNPAQRKTGRRPA